MVSIVRILLLAAVLKVFLRSPLSIPSNNTTIFLSRIYSTLLSPSLLAVIKKQQKISDKIYEIKTETKKIFLYFSNKKTNMKHKVTHGKSKREFYTPRCPFWQYMKDFLKPPPHSAPTFLSGRKLIIKP